MIPFAINLFLLINKTSIWNIVLTVINFLGIIGTYSRTSTLIAIFMVAIFLLFPQGQKRVGIKRLFIVSVLLVSIVVIISTFFSDFIDRLNTIQEAATIYKGSGRYPLYLEAINNFESNPIFGIGTGQTVYKSPFKLETHNLFLQTLGENGLFGFVVLIALFGHYLRKGYVIRHENRLFLIAGIAVFLNANTVSFFDLRLFFSLFVLLNYNYYWRTCDTILAR